MRVHVTSPSSCLRLWCMSVLSQIQSLSWPGTCCRPASHCFQPAILAVSALLLHLSDFLFNVLSYFPRVLPLLAFSTQSLQKFLLDTTVNISLTVAPPRLQAFNKIKVCPLSLWGLQSNEEMKINLATQVSVNLYHLRSLKRGEGPAL